MPAPASISPELLKQHSLTAEEYARIEAALGRTPSLTELGIYSVMWSEHCSYKSSRVHLKRLPHEERTWTRASSRDRAKTPASSTSATAGPAPSRSSRTTTPPISNRSRARPPASAAFCATSSPWARGRWRSWTRCASGRSRPRSGERRPALVRKNHPIVEGVVAGIAGYGNCFGVPNLGGETRFEPCYSGNPLVNAFALGLVRRDEIFYAKATGVGNPVIYVGAKTGRDGIHGATMASEEFKEGSEQKRPNVQMGDPFMEKLLLEACLEAMQTGAVVGIQDMGAAGLTCSTCEMGGARRCRPRGRARPRAAARNRHVQPTRSCSGDQERMLLVAEKGREDEVLRVFEKWGLDAVIVGDVIARAAHAHPPPRRAGRRHSQPVAHRRRPALPSPRRHLEGTRPARSARGSPRSS